MTRSPITHKSVSLDCTTAAYNSFILMHLQLPSKDLFPLKHITKKIKIYPAQVTMAVRVAVVVLSLIIISGQADARDVLGVNRDRHNKHQTRMTSAGVSQDTCKQTGWDIGGKVATKACAATKTWCSKATRTFPAPAFATLKDCGHAAAHGCMNRATERDLSPCAVAMRGGQGYCTQHAFIDHYKYVAQAECNALAVAADKPRGR